MLTAKLTNGETFILTKSVSRKKLIDIREKETFYCPCCKEKVILKIGTKKISHFAHQRGTNCPVQFEPESQYHLLGKLKLYEWLKEKNVKVRLEPYYHEIQQRGDVEFTYEGKTYCIEFQCSNIPEQRFYQRTIGYKRRNIEPIWILGAYRKKEKKGNKGFIPNFHSLFFNKNSENDWYFLTFCPEQNRLFFHYQLYPLSSQIFYYKSRSLPLKSATISEFIHPIFPDKPNLTRWDEEIQRFKRSLLTYKGYGKEPFLRTCYLSRFPLQFLPPFVGLPLKHNLIFKTSPLIWQGYIFLDFFLNRKKGFQIELPHVYFTLKRKIKIGELKIRQMQEHLLNIAIEEYFSALEKRSIVYEEKENCFTLEKEFLMTHSKQWKFDENSFFSNITLNDFHFNNID